MAAKKAQKKKENAKSKAWVIFDRIVADAAKGGLHSNPWSKNSSGELCYGPDYNTLAKLLGVPLYLNANTQSGVPALALDVWLSYELRRAGFDADATWPRPVHPRILPAPVVRLLHELPAKLGKPLREHISNKASISGVTASSASILGKNYPKQVDVIITDWDTGPELLISTKRMDSSYSKNAPNRVEESYGDVKNLRLRHPLAALGFLFGLRSDILQNERATFDWLVDLLEKLGSEEDAYHATCLVLMDYKDGIALNDDDEDNQGTSEASMPVSGLEAEEDLGPPPEFDVSRAIADLPPVKILLDQIPGKLAPSTFLAAMVSRVLAITPVNMHKEARCRRSVP